MKLINKEDFITDTIIYNMLVNLEQSVLKEDEFAISILLTKLKQLKITFEVSSEKIDPKSQCQ